jgi:ABC-type Na+ efflux pump permease subunit
VVSGKFLAVVVPALLALGVMLVSAAAAVTVGGRLLAPGPQTAVLPAQALLPLILVGAALGGLLSASQVAVSLAAASLREAQQAFAALYLVVALPAMVLPFLEGAAVRPWMALVPVLNAALAVRGVLLAEASTFQVAATASSLVALTPPVLLLGVRLLDAQGRRIR